ncbi:hypothetical protein PROFUN_13057 [Planoprotostelium fungivorum]|uniref:Uncharacterized protein n=1 Tax=Planoprotostelium fungivorum TaxID=1890364 RepID=A0A2P6N5F4_9EUKA|nr:hypothetical protein PROFUN_13057 [Planoprotostelium fungivorum]
MPSPKCSVCVAEKPTCSRYFTDLLPIASSFVKIPGDQLLHLERKKSINGSQEKAIKCHAYDISRFRWFQGRTSSYREIFTPDAVRSVDLSDRLGTHALHFYLYLSPIESIRPDRCLQVERPYELGKIILTRLSNMQSILCTLLFIITLCHAQTYDLTLSIIPPTGFFSPVYTARNSSSLAYFTYVSSIDDSLGNFSSALNLSCVVLCDGELVIYAPYSPQDLQLSPPINITVTNAVITGSAPDPSIDIIDISLGVTYTVDAPTYFRFTTLNPYFFEFIYNPRGSLSSIFHDTILVEAGTISDAHTKNPLYLLSTELITSFTVTVPSANSFTLEDISYLFVFPAICATDSSAYLLRDGTTPQMVNAFSCFKLEVGSATNYTLVSVQTPPTLVISSSGEHSAPCTNIGTSVDKYALIKFNATDLIGQAYLDGSYYSFDLTNAFDLAINCGMQDSITVSAVISPEQVVNVDPLHPSIEIITPVVQVVIPPGIIAIGDRDNLLQRTVGFQSCTNSTFSVNYGGGINSLDGFGVCHTVSSESVINTEYIRTVLVLRPPSKHCLRIDGLPADGMVSAANTLKFSYEGSDMFFSAVTCSDDIMSLYANPGVVVNITLVKVECQATYGQTYDIDGLFIIQYPPTTKNAAVRAYNVTGTAAFLTNNHFPSVRANDLLSNQPDSQYIAIVTGRGQFTTNLGTSDGVNTGYDRTYQSLDGCPLGPSTMTSSESITSSDTTSSSSSSTQTSTSSVASTSSFVVDSTADSSFADDSTSIDETTSEVDASSPSTLANIKSSSSVSITSSVDKSSSVESSSSVTSSASTASTTSSVTENGSVTDDNTGFVDSGTFYDTATSVSTTASGPLTNGAETINISVLSIAITMIVSMFLWTSG